MTQHILDRDAFAQHLDASWQTFRKQLLEVYPNGPSLQTVEPFPPIIGHTFEEAFEGAPVDLDSAAHAVADTARQISDEVGAESKAPTDEIAVRKGSISPSIDSDVVRQGYSGHLLQSGLRGLSEEDVAAVKDRLRLRLGILSPKTLVSGSALLESVSALGLTRYTEEDMNEFVNMLGDFVQLEFVTKLERRPSQNNVTMNTMLFGAQEVMETPECKLGKPKWQWPSATATRDLPTMRASLSLKGGGERVLVQPSRRTTTYNVIPAQPLLDIFLAQETEVHRRIFGAKGLNQYRAIKEILLAGDTNRLVAELTFVRINDLAAPPEPMHPIMYLEPLVAVLIIGNGIMIGFQTDPNYKDWDGWVYIEMVFAVCRRPSLRFLVEPKVRKHAMWGARSTGRNYGRIGTLACKEPVMQVTELVPHRKSVSTVVVVVRVGCHVYPKKDRLRMARWPGRKVWDGFQQIRHRKRLWRINLQPCTRTKHGVQVACSRLSVRGCFDSS